MWTEHASPSLSGLPVAVVGILQSGANDHDRGFFHLKQEIPLGEMIRTSDAATLAHELRAVREITLALFDAYEAAGLLDVPCQEEFNLPLWELGHVGWFQQWWIGRNQQRDLGVLADPDHARLSCPVIGQPHHGDAWYNSSSVPHAARWQLPLLDARKSKRYLQCTLDQTLDCLSRVGHSDEALYFYRLVLLHEAMHVEAAVYMAQALQRSITMPLSLGNATKLIANYDYSTGTMQRFDIKNELFKLATRSETGFSFDNELGAHDVLIAAFEIDAKPITWQQYLEFTQAASYPMPAYLRHHGGRYEHIVFGQWQPLSMQMSAVHINWFDAQAYCLWAGRRLPTEAEWECAISQEPGMAWGDVWEWTASDFKPYPGFVAHPYRDYSEPWFGSRKVLRGACAATLPIMRSAKYRNFFLPDRADIYAGFRTCAK
jgi:gamma-glutamyl hercynylcysteine S-oxide synthase